MPIELINSSWFYAQFAEQYERAELARWRGQDDVALQTFGAVRHSLLLTAPAALASAELLERQSDLVGARREYGRASRLLARAEPIRADWVERARAGLERLRTR